MRTCQICKQNKHLSKFNKDKTKKKGHRYYCKECQKKYRQSERGKLIHNRYQKSGKAKIAQKRYRILHPEYHKAGIAVNMAIQTNKLPRLSTLQCYDCPAQAQHYHHYNGYKPKHWLDVIPVCLKCHNKYRKKTA